MKLKSIWGLLIAIIEIEINANIVLQSFRKEFYKPKKVFTKKGNQKNRILQTKKIFNRRGNPTEKTARQ